MKQLVRNLGEAGIPMLCLNFMAGTDWVRTRLDAPERGGARVTAFDLADAERAVSLSETTGEIDDDPVSADQLGGIFNHDMRSLGVDVRLEAAKDGLPTARSHILITADGQRTMQTYLGACTELSVDDITTKTMGTPKAVLIEGYVWDLPEGPELTQKAIAIAKQNGTTVALSLSDSFCVERHRDSFEHAIRNGVDIVVADEDEVGALVQQESFDDVLEALDDYDNLFAITRSAKGSVIVHGDEYIVQAATPVDEVIDTTGAGDAYTAGFLYGWVNDQSLQECAKIGTFCGSTVIQQLGARIEPGLLDNYS